MKRRYLHYWVIALFACSSGACQKEVKNDAINPGPGQNNLRIDFKPMVDSLLLRIGETYTNYFNENYQISQFKFYVSQVDLINTDSNKIYRLNRDQYFLVDAADSSSWSVNLSAAPARFNAISFIVGVDSLRNVSGAQTGALDPAKGMFWTWNSGYIMAKLEGTSPASSLPNQKFEYHIGGFKGIENVLIRPVLVFPFGQFSELVTEKKTVITVCANANSWFNNPHDIKIKEIPACTTPGGLAKTIAENYAGMFTVVQITNN